MPLAPSHCLRVGVLIAALLGAEPAALAASSHTVKLVATVALPDRGGFADYMALHPQTDTLYVGYTGADMLVGIDTRSNTVRQTIEHLPRVHTIAFGPNPNLGYSANGGDDTVGVIDLPTGKLLRKLPAGHGPDALHYSAPSKLLYVSDHKGDAATLIDLDQEAVVGTVPLGGKAEYAQTDSRTGLIYQNLEDTSETVVVDPRHKSVVARFKTGPGEGPTGLYLDEASARLFVACDNGKLVVLNERDGSVVSSVDIGTGCDFVDYDPVLKRLYTANGDSGTMSVVAAAGPDAYRRIEEVTTYPRAHALKVDPKTHRIYVVYSGHVAVYDAQR